MPRARLLLSIRWPFPAILLLAGLLARDSLELVSTKKSTKAPKVVQLTEKLNWYGLKSAATGKITNQLEIELALFNRPSGSSLLKDGSKNKDGIPKWKHFVNAVNLVWNYKGSTKPFTWHPWAIQMAKASCRHKRLAVAGCASSGKSDFYAVYAIIVWLSNPYKNVVLVTTTTLKDAKGRIWGRLASYFQAMIVPPPGKLVGSSYEIKTFNQKTNTVHEEYGIKLFAGEQSKSAESSKAIRGRKAGVGGRIVVILDEMAELGSAVVKVFEENLTANKDAQIIGIANPDSIYDTFGLFCEPPKGWESVSESDFEWEGKGGHVIRFDAELSPNVVEGRVIYPFLLTSEQLADKKEQKASGRLSARGYFRGVKGFWLMDADDAAVYSPAEIIKSHKECIWQSEYTSVAGFDPAFTSGGDRSVLTIGKVGICTDSLRRVKVEKHFYLNEDLKNKNVDRTTQIVDQLIKICKENGVAPENLGVDSTGAGKTFCDVLSSRWSNRVLRVDFGGKASDLPVSSLDREKSSVRFANKVSEIWTVGKELLRCDQVRNITNEAAEEMTARKYHESKAGDGGSRLRVESKIELKKRMGKSCDIADSLFIMFAVCRERHKLSGIDKAGNYDSKGKSPMKKRFAALSSIYA